MEDFQLGGGALHPTKIGRSGIHGGVVASSEG